MDQVAIMGGGIAGLMAAVHLKQRLPNLDVVIIAPEQRTGPLVGEALTEFSTFFVRELGLASYLEETQYKKYGLTFHFKCNIDDPNDRRYRVDEAAAGPTMPAFLLNRVAFDAKLKAHALSAGVQWLVGRVDDVTLGPSGHEVTWSDPQGQTHKLTTRWLIDASGRRRLLARKLGIGVEASSQRSCFWFRLRGIDRDYLQKAIALKPRQDHFDPYFSAQHFFGRGKWVWCIPFLTGREAQEGYSISVGMTWRPDMVAPNVHDIDSFIETVNREHPVIGDLVRSATVIDTQLYRNYMYSSSRMYDPSGWFIIGDAGWTVDPMYSSGLALIAVQAGQIAELIARDSAQPELSQVFDACFLRFHQTVSHIVDQLYVRMHDPYQAFWTINHFGAVYFHCILPMLLAGYHTHPIGARLFSTLMGAGRTSTDSLHGLLEPGARRCPEISTRTLPNQHRRIINWRLWGPDEPMVPTDIARFLRLSAGMRLELLHKAGWPDLGHHLGMACSDLLGGLTLPLLFHKRSPLDSRLIASALNRGVAPAPVRPMYTAQSSRHSGVRQLLDSCTSDSNSTAGRAAGAPSSQRGLLQARK